MRICHGANQQLGQLNLLENDAADCTQLRPCSSIMKLLASDGREAERPFPQRSQVRSFPDETAMLSVIAHPAYDICTEVSIAHGPAVPLLMQHLVLRAS